MPSQPPGDAGVLDHPTGFALAADDPLRAVALADPNSSLVAPPWRNKVTAPFESLLRTGYCAGCLHTYT